MRVVELLGDDITYKEIEAEVRNRFKILKSDAGLEELRETSLNTSIHASSRVFHLKPQLIPLRNTADLRIKDAKDQRAFIRMLMRVREKRDNNLHESPLICNDKYRHILTDDYFKA